MRFTLSETAPHRIECDVLALPVLEPGALTGEAMHADRAVGGRLAEMARSDGFIGKTGQTALLFAPDAPFRRALLVGAGAEISPEAVRRYAATAVKRAMDVRAARVALAPGAADPECARAAVEGAGLGAYRFQRYRTAKDGAQVEEVVVCAPDGGRGALERAVRAGDASVRATCLARDLVNEPANVLTPARFADVAREIAGRAELRFRVIQVEEARETGMGLFCAVAAGSAEPAKFIVLEYDPAGTAGAQNAAAGDSGRTVALVGKGITFDTGGLDVKSTPHMATMKNDMAGAAAVVGAMSALRDLEIPVRVLGIAAAAENAIGGRAMRPGDVVRSLAGKTVEITNTDAEGRLVLADALAYAVRAGAAELIDLATLTGSCVTALGDHTAGLMGNSQPLMDRLLRAAALAGEQLWQLPLFDEFREAMQGDIADLKNSTGRSGGAERAAAFMGEFVGAVPWAHLDIAGPAFCEEKGAPPYVPMGGTGYGVRTLLRYLASAM